MISLFSKDIVMFKSTFPSLWRLVFEVVKNALEKFMFMIPTVSYYGVFFQSKCYFLCVGFNSVGTLSIDGLVR